MRLWLLTVFVLFALVQGFQWLKGAMLPLPLHVLAGAFLAIASNYERGVGKMLSGDLPTPAEPPIQTAILLQNPQLPESAD